MKKAIIFFVAFALAGCAIGPDYRRPSQEMPQSWRFEEEKAVKDAANMAWWEQMGDPVLKELIQIALTENKDVKIAAARVEQFMGLYGTTRSGTLPADRRRRYCRQAEIQRGNPAHTLAETGSFRSGFQ